MSGKSCNACKKSILFMDISFACASGTYHKPCFKCSHCSGQLTLSTFAELSGKLYCKTHYKEIFSRRGKYDDIDGNVSSPVANGNVSRSVSAPVEEPVDVTPTPSAPVPAPVSEPTHSETAAVVPDDAPVEDSPPAIDESPAEVVESESKEAVSPPENSEVVAEVALVESVPAEPVVSIPETPRDEVTPVTVVEKEVLAIDPKDVPSGLVSKLIASQSTKSNPSSPVPSSNSTSTPTIAPARGASISARLGGGGSKCVSCAKSVYAADPKLSIDQKVWHSACAVCKSCSQRVDIQTFAQIEGNIFHKACFFKLFGARGKYDDVLKSVEASSTTA